METKVPVASCVYKQEQIRCQRGDHCLGVANLRVSSSLRCGGAHEMPNHSVARFKNIQPGEGGALRGATAVIGRLSHHGSGC